MELIIDESGRVREVAHSEGTAIAIRALGLAGVRVDGAEVSVTWDVQRVEHDVLLALRKLVAESKEPLPFRLCFYYGGWSEERYGNNWSALDRLNRLAAFADTDPPTEAGKVAKDIDCSKNEKVHWLSRFWHRTEGRLEAEDLSSLQAFSPNIMALENMRFGFVGEKTLMAQVCKPEDIAQMIGQPYDQDPAEPPFARSVVDEYTKARARREPYYDHVCAPLNLYGVDRWLRYERLICPFSLPDRREILTVLCEPSQHIDVPFLQFQTQ